MTQTRDALIGFTGFVGSTLLRQTEFAACFRSTTIDDIDHRAFDTLVCAGAPAQKWIANREPQADLQTIDSLINHLCTVRCKVFVLISTVDVFAHPVGVDEYSPVNEIGLHPYGLHRRRLEKFVAGHFPRHLIVRLPGLVGPGLRKNVVYDLQHDNNLAAIDSRGVFQFYPMVNLWYDIQTALKAGLSLVHLCAEPISVARLALQGFGHPLEQHVVQTPALYDMHSRFASLFGTEGRYLYSARDTLQAVRAYAQAEHQAMEAHP